ncbi:MAG: hypothetical protein ACI4JI_08485 [Ruminiclostridium sp.]
MPESERPKCGTDAAPQSVHKGLGVRDREFALLFKNIDFFDILMPPFLRRHFYAKIGVEYENLVKDIPVFSSDLQNTVLCVIINLHICMQIREVE